MTNPHIEERALRRVAYRLIPFMVLLYFLAYLDRVNVGFAALTMNKDLGITATMYGWAAGIFFLGYFLFEIPSNLVLARVGARRWIARIMITWGLLSAAMALVRGPQTYLVLRFLLGAAEAGFFPGMILYLTYWFPAPVRGKLTAIFMVAIPLSSSIGAPLSSLLLGLDGALGLSGWQWLFLMEGIPSIVVGIVVLSFMTDRPEKATWLPADERSWLVGTISKEQEELSRQHNKHSVSESIKDGKVWLLCFVYLTLIIGLYGVGFWLPQIIKSFGLSNTEVGFAISIPYAVAALGMILWARHSDRTGERTWHVAIGGLVGSVGIAASAFTSSPTLSLATFSIGALGIFGALPTFWTLPTARLSGAAAAGGIALINSVGNLGGFAGPYIVGWIKDSTMGFTGGLLFIAASMFAGAATLVASYSRKGSATKLVTEIAPSN